MRQEAVEFLIQNGDLAQELRRGLKKIPMDLERATSRVWGYALEAERQAVFYADVTAKRLGEFRGLLGAYERGAALLAQVPAGQAVPGRLAQIARRRDAGGCFPDLQGIMSGLMDSIVEDTSAANGKVKFQPRKGAYAPYDQLTHNIENVKASLEQELEGIKQKLNRSDLCFAHRLGFRYEVTGDLQAFPPDFLRGVDETFRNKTRLNFQTKRMKQLVVELETLEDKRQDCIFPFLSQMFQKFYAHQAQFRTAVRCLAELDSLLSLAMTSQNLPGSSCRPEIVASADPTTSGSLELRNCRHPIAAAKLGTAFVPNDTFMNTPDVPSVLVVTGPNMGGKSTVLRQTCIE